MIRRLPQTEILLLYRFAVGTGELAPPAIAKLAPYLTRYADTLNVRVVAVGGVTDLCTCLPTCPAI